MSRTKLDGLPPEVLYRIAQCLPLRHGYLERFGRVNRTCRAAALPTLYEQLTFHVVSFRSLERDVHDLEEALALVDGFKHVRHFYIWGWPEEFEESENHCDSSECDHDQYRPWRREMISLPDYIKPYIKPTSTRYASNAAWQPLARLLGRLSGLVDLSFNCTSQLPPCLLHALQTGFPNCRLHLYCFHLNSLRDEGQQLDRHEHALINHKSLTTVWAKHSLVGNQGRSDFTDLTVMAMISCLAPALTDVRMAFRIALLSDGPDALSNLDRATRLAHLHGSGKKGKLDRLELGRSIFASGEISITGHTLEEWSKVTNFSVLTGLMLRFPGETALSWVVDQSPFKNLTSLEIDLDSDNVRQQPKHVTDFLKALPPLESISISGDITADNLDALMCQHGSKLRHLDLLRRYDLLRRFDLFTSHVQVASTIFFHSARLQQLRLLCPHLEKVSLPLLRTMGSREEIDTYIALGSFPRLRQITLSLDCSIHSLMTDFSQQNQNDSNYKRLVAATELHLGDWEDELFLPALQAERPYGHPLRNGHVIQALVNAAIDSKFVSTVWSIVSSSRPRGATPLHELLVVPVRGGYLGFTEEYLPIENMDRVFRHLALKWQVERHRREDIQTDATMASSEPDEILQNLEEDKDLKVPPVLVPVMEKIWPGILDEGTSWKTGWASLPLRLDADMTMERIWLRETHDSLA